MPTFAAISDLHGYLPEAPEGADFVVIAGDICPHFSNSIDKKQSEWLDGPFREWLEAINAPVVATWGNHDFVGMQPDLVPELPWVLLVDQAVEIDGVTFYGTPWVPNLPNWAFNAEPEALKERAVKIPFCDVLISHSPPLGYVDWCKPNLRHAHGASAGDYYLRGAIEREQPQLVICGHIHEARGVERLSNIPIHNVAMLDERYKPYAYSWTVIEV